MPKCVICSQHQRDLDSAKIRLSEPGSPFLNPDWKMEYRNSRVLEQDEERIPPKRPELIVVAAIHDGSTFFLETLAALPKKPSKRFYVGINEYQIGIADRNSIPHGNYDSLKDFAKRTFPTS